MARREGVMARRECDSARREGVMARRGRERGYLFLGGLIMSLLLNGCQQKEEKKETLLIGAAASLKTVMEQIETKYEEKEGVSLYFTYASSGTLEQQIRQGAPIDVLLSASNKQIQALSEDQYLMEETVADLLENKLALIVPSDSALGLTGFDDVIRAKKIALGDPGSVPAGSYAREIFAYYGVLEEVERAAIYGKDVTEVLTWVSSGNVDAGVVYTSDALMTDKVSVVAIAPEESHSRVVYPAGVVRGTKQETAAKDFLVYLSGDEARDIFEEYGFIPIK